MKISPTTRGAVALGLLLCLVTPTVAQRGGKSSGSKGSSATAKQEMKGINKAVKAIGKFLKSPDGDAPMDAVQDLQQQAMTAKFKVPALAAKQPADQRAAFLQAYRKQVNVLIRASLDLEEAMIGKQWDKAGQILAAIDDAKKTGHREFKGRSKRGR